MLVVTGCTFVVHSHFFNFRHHGFERTADLQTPVQADYDIMVGLRDMLTGRINVNLS